MKHNFLFACLLSCFLTVNVNAQISGDSVIWLQSVHDVEWGEGEFASQRAEFFPDNLNAPTTSATRFAPSTSFSEILSLGLHGSIELFSEESVCVDLPGPDFVIFENAFEIQGIGRLFVEPAQVSVSKDGINWVSFEFDSTTLTGAAGIDYTIGEAIPTNVLEAGGTKFDLATVGLDSVRYFRITDVSALLKQLEHPLFDPIVDGFDLDALGLLHHKPFPISSVQRINEDNPIRVEHTTLHNQSNSRLVLSGFDVLGNRLFTKSLHSRHVINIQDISTIGVVVVVCRDLNGRVIQTIKLLNTSW